MQYIYLKLLYTSCVIVLVFFGFDHLNIGEWIVYWHWMTIIFKMYLLVELFIKKYYNSNWNPNPTNIWSE